MQRRPSGDPERIPWNVDDPSALTGTPEERQRAFDEIAGRLITRMRIWMTLPNVGGSRAEFSARATRKSGTARQARVNCSGISGGTALAVHRR